MVFVSVVAAMVQVIGASTTTHFSMSLPSVLMPILALQRNLGSAAGWSVLALLVAFISAKLSMRLAGGRA
jgi:hypothetical protein